VALLKDKYAPIARNFFGSFLRVIRETAPLEYDPEEICKGELAPHSEGPFSIEADFVLVLKMYYNPNIGTMASAKYCKYSSANLRPLVGMATWNLYYFSTDESATHENTKTLLHEVSHALGVSRTMAVMYIHPTDVPRVFLGSENVR
jgi:hypothetical protein